MDKFCDNCKSRFRIMGSLPKSVEKNVKKKKESVMLKRSSGIVSKETIDEFFDNISEKKTLSKRNLAQLDIDAIINDPRYQTLGTTEKNKIRTFAKLNLKDSSSNNVAPAYLVCQKCFNYELLPYGVIWTSSRTIPNFDKSLSKNLVSDRTYPRTRFQICPNKACSASVDPAEEPRNKRAKGEEDDGSDSASEADEFEREFIMRKVADRRMSYICCNCYTVFY